MSVPAAALNLDGYTDLPPDKIATIVTYLEMREAPVPVPGRRRRVGRSSASIRTIALPGAVPDGRRALALVQPGGDGG